MRIRLFRVFSALLLVSVLAPALSPPAKAQELTKVRFGVSPFQDTLLPIVGEEMGWYEEEGLDVEFVILGWTEVQEALAAGEVDVAINNITSVIATHERFPEFVYWYGFNIFDQGAALMAGPEYMSVEEFEAEGMARDEAIKAALDQMRGKTVITTGNTDMEQAVVGAAYRNGLDYTKDFQIVDLNPDEGLAAFLSGQGDFYLGGIAQRTRASQEGRKAIVSGPDLAPPPINGIVTTAEYAAANQDVLLSLLHVWFRIVNFVQDDTDAGAQIVLDTLNSQTGSNMSVDDFKTFWQNYETFPLTPEEVQSEILDPDGYSFWRNNWDDSNRYFHDVKGSISAPLDPEGVFLMEEAQEAYLAKYGG
ncbi:MAG: ABC transporter substrate-binding protein [Chloroflexota bacterium]|nr:ABC transporter substrate-binding protein [Chloroflexota bacterium]